MTNFQHFALKRPKLNQTWGKPNAKTKNIHLSKVYTNTICLKHLKIDHLCIGTSCVREACASCVLVCLWLLKHKRVSARGIRGSAFLFHVCSESLCLQSDRIVLGQQKGLHHRSVWNATQQRVAAGLRNAREIDREKKLISVTGSFVCWKAWLSLSLSRALSLCRART